MTPEQSRILAKLKIDMAHSMAQDVITLDEFKAFELELHAVDSVEGFSVQIRTVIEKGLKACKS